MYLKRWNYQRRSRCSFESLDLFFQLPSDFLVDSTPDLLSLQTRVRWISFNSLFTPLPQLRFSSAQRQSFWQASSYRKQGTQGICDRVYGLQVHSFQPVMYRKNSICSSRKTSCNKTASKRGYEHGKTASKYSFCGGSRHNNGRIAVRFAVNKGWRTYGANSL